MNDLFGLAERARAHAYAPYSGYRVGAALRGAGGGLYAGGNVENAAFPQGQCAEASAIGAMVAAGETRIVEALVLGGDDALCTPCGGCRQRLREFVGPELPIHLCGPAGPRRTVTLGELLPLSFGPDNLGGPAAPRPATAAEVVRERARGRAASRVGLILGSGLGPVAGLIEEPVAIPYGDLPGFPRPSVEGHRGRLLLGRVAGVGVACLQGRVHLYEGAPVAAVNAPIRTLRALGCELLIATNASGSLRPDLAPGSIALIEDHINLLGANPLTGPNDAAVGPRFPDMSVAYDPDLRARLRAAAGRLGVALPGAVYLATPGPSFETPAEIRAFRALGADLVGMSTVLEVISARHCGLRVAALSIVVNLAAGMSRAPLGHEETLAVAGRAAGTVAALLRTFLEDLAHAAGR